MIDDNINSLIAMAEQQSDQRLAQELNPETETGLLGPAFISASELAYRQKIRSEAQAQPNNNPPIVQQLAQAVTPPMQVSMQNEMPMPAAPMPQQQMPQQMPPQGFAMGGLIRMANGGLTPYEYDEKEIEDRSKEKARGFFGNLLSDIAYGAGDASALGRYSRGENPDEFLYGRDRFDSALERAGLPSDATPEMVSAYRSGTPIEAFVSAIPAGNPLLQESKDKVEQSGSAQARNPNNRNLNIGGGTGLNPSIVTTPTNNDVSKINNQGNTTTAPTADTLKTVTQDTTDLLDPNSLINQAKANSSPVPIFKEQPKNITKAADKDAKIGALSEYEQLIEDQIKLMTDPKGKMQDKWLRIAAGAFNAAQKGSPTLLGGLADLGGGVTEQLLAFNADEQKQAQELFTLYTAREELRRTSLTTERDIKKDEKTRLAKAITDYHSDKARYYNVDITQDLSKEEADAMLATTYADQGVELAKEDYGRAITKIRAAQEKIIQDIKDNSDTGTVTNEEYLSKLDEYLSTNPDLRIYFDNYKNRQSPVEDWLGEKLLEDD
jgi:hypothetical protein